MEFVDNMDNQAEGSDVNSADSGSQTVNETHFDILKLLGKGGFGKVYLVEKLTGVDTGRLYAMKLIRKALLKNKKTVEHAMTERQVHEIVGQKPFLSNMTYAFQDETRLFLILDYIKGGDLHSHLCEREELFSPNEVRIYIGEIILAVHHLHKMGIIHRDIKLENVLIDHEGHIVLVDFGLSKLFLPHERENGRTHSFCGTTEYMAPEIVRRRSAGYSFAVDWWSVGVLMYELLTGTSPFAGQEESKRQIQRRIVKAEPLIPKDFGPAVNDFISGLLVKDPAERLGGGPGDAEELKSHLFFKTAPPPFSWSALERREVPPPFVPTVSQELDCSESDSEAESESADELSNVPSDCKKMMGYSYAAAIAEADLSEEILSSPASPIPSPTSSLSPTYSSLTSPASSVPSPASSRSPSASPPSPPIPHLSAPASPDQPEVDHRWVTANIVEIDFIVEDPEEMPRPRKRSLEQATTNSSESTRKKDKNCSITND